MQEKKARKTKAKTENMKSKKTSLGPPKKKVFFYI